VFLAALFVLASGVVIVQVVANPLISLLGKPATAHIYAQHVARGSHGLDIKAPIGAAVHPIGTGTVSAAVPASQGGDSGNYVMVKHPDGTTSSYAHLGNISVKVGDPVNADTVVGTVGMTGHTTGPHVHLRTRDASGNDVDPQSVIGTNAKGAAGATVVGSPNAPRDIDKAAAYAAIDRRSDWSFEQKKMAKEGVDGMAASFDDQLKRQREDASEAADQVVTGMIIKGQNFTSTSQIPRSTWNTLSPADQLKWAKFADSNKPGVAAPKADSPAAAELKIMQFDPSYKDADLSRFAGKVTPGEFVQAIVAKAKAVKDYQSGNQEWSPRSGITSAVSYGETMGGLKLKPEEKAAVMQAMEAQARALHRQSGKEPTDNDYQAFFRSATRKVAVPGMIWGTNQVPAYDANKVPADADARIRARWKAAGRTPTDEDVLQSYRAGG
jgi:hypothetical protein